MKRLFLRKIYRLALLAVVIIYYYWPKKYTVLAVFLAFLFSLALDIIRLVSPRANEVVKATFKPFARFMRFIAKKEELRDLTGTTYSLMGCTIIVVFFPRYIGIPAILFNTFGDMAATMVGKSIGHIKIMNGKKTAEGSIACFITMFLVVIWAHIKLQLPFLAGTLGALTGTVTELISLKINDNLTIPIFSGVVMWLLH